MLIRKPALMPLSARAAFPPVASETRPMGLRCPRRSVVVFAGGPAASEHPARALERSLIELGVATRYVGRERDAGRIAEIVVDEGADAVELCLAGDAGGVLLLRELLRRLIEIGRRDVSIVVHRAK
jgi:methylmalonyl-CoA mutase cobalamin-binding subunit